MSAIDPRCVSTRLSAILLLVACQAVAVQATRADIDVSPLLTRESARTASGSPTSAPDADDPQAIFELATRYDTGDGVPQDYAEAAKWYRKAAEQGHADAQVNLGLMYTDGQGVEKDDLEAVRWFERAAKDGNSRAMYSLGLMHYHGRGVDRDFERAYEWYEKAARDGSAKAMNNIGIMFGLGEGVAQDDVNAYAWFALAARYGDLNGEKNRDLTLAELSEERLERARELFDALSKEIRAP